MRDQISEKYPTQKAKQRRRPQDIRIRCRHPTPKSKEATMAASARLFALFRWLMLAGLMVGAGGVLAANAYSDNGDGTLTDITTGLV